MKYGSIFLSLLDCVLGQSMSIWIQQWTCPGWVFCPQKNISLAMNIILHSSNCLGFYFSWRWYREWIGLLNLELQSLMLKVVGNQVDYCCIVEAHLLLWLLCCPGQWLLCSESSHYIGEERCLCCLSNQEAPVCPLLFRECTCLTTSRTRLLVQQMQSPECWTALSTTFGA